MQVRFGWLLLCFLPPVRGTAEIDRLGEIERSSENRTDEDDTDGDELYRLTRVGEVEPRKKVVGREAKLEDEEAKAEEE